MKTRCSAPFGALLLFLSLFPGNLSAALPDLSLTDADIVFSNATPEPGEVITVSATVRNRGDVYFETTPFSSHDYQTGTSTRTLAVYYSIWLAQYFVPESDIPLLGKISLYLRNAADNSEPTDPVTLEIRKDQGDVLKPSPLGASLVASKTLTVSATTYGWQDFVFDSPPSLAAGATYWICLENYSSIGASDGYGWCLDSGTAVDMVGASIDRGNEWNGAAAVSGSYAAFYRSHRCVDTIVSCYRGDPAAGGTLIGVSTISVPVPFNGSRTVSFSWPAAAGASDIYVTVDRPGLIPESLENNNSAAKSITVTATLPRLAAAVSPAENAVGVPPDEPVRIVFSEDMDPARAQAAVAVAAVADNRGTSLGDAPVAGAAVYANKTVTFSAAPWTKGCTYRVTVSTGAQDLFGNALPAPKTWTFTVLMDHAAENTCADGDGAVRVTLPQEAVDADYLVVIDTDPLAEPSLGARIADANDKMKRSRGSFFSPLPGGVRRFTLYRAGVPFAGPFARNATITFSYARAGNGLVQDAGGRWVKEKTLGIYRLDETNNLWVKLPGALVDTERRTVSAQAGHFSVYALIGGSDTDLSNAYAYPVPWKPFAGNPETGSPEGGITFAGLGSQATIRIYTLSGEPVKALQYRYAGGEERQVWDGTNDHGEPVASGVYIYYIANEKEHASGKLVIVK